MRVFRWILLPVVSFAAWIAALVTGMAAHSVVESFCPADQMISGLCVAPWFESVDAWLVRFFSAFAAALIIVSCYFTAPAARAIVAWVVLGAGGIYALFLAIVSWAWGEFIAAGAGGLAVVWLLTRGQNIATKPGGLKQKTPSYTASDDRARQG